MALEPNFLSLVLNMRRRTYTRITKYNDDGVLHLASYVFELCLLSSIEKYKRLTHHILETIISILRENEMAT